MALAWVVVLVVAAMAAAAGCASPQTEATSPTTGPATTQSAPSLSSSAPGVPPSARGGHERLAEVDSWAFAIGDGALDGTPAAVAERLGVFDLVVVDGEEVTAEQVAAVRARGTVVLAYLSVGTIEPWRSWYGRLEPFALERWDAWGEYYADIGEPGYRAEIGRIVAALLDKGFDGLFLDNVDMVESHPDQTEGMRLLVSDLSHVVRVGGGSRGDSEIGDGVPAGLLFAQNGDDFALALAGLLDGWNMEDVTFGYDFDTDSYVRTPALEHEAALATIASMRAADVFVTTTDYVGTAGSADEVEALGAARRAGALPYVSDIELTRIPVTPFVSPSP